MKETMRGWRAPVLMAGLACVLFRASACGAWETAGPGYAWKFPRDHGSHPDFRTEWWYYVGHLRDAGGKRYGFQLAFFRVGLDPAVENPSAFTPRNLYFSHFAVSDLSGGRFWYADRMDRPGPGLAGASQGRLDLRLEDWKACREGGGHRLEASAGPFGLDLKVWSPFPPVLQGDRGYSRKGSGKGNASLYYSFPLLYAGGTLRAGNQDQPVTGKAWMDHEFFSGGLDGDETGWNWFGLQMDDGTELMVYFLRDKDGGFDPASAGTWVSTSGKGTRLRAAQIRAVPLQNWKSPATGGVYPIQWLLDIPSLGLSLHVGADLPDQELRTPRTTGVDYWEGSVHVDGLRAGKKIKGSGYLELTGRDKPFGGFSGDGGGTH
jgi:predicted secreted hydrolase